MLFNICIRESWQDVWLLRLAASDECEEYMISKLKVNDQTSSFLSSDYRSFHSSLSKSKCGHHYTAKMQRMFQDMHVSETISDQFRDQLTEGTGGQLSPRNFTLMVLTANYWSLSSCAPFTLPREVSIALVSPPHRPHRRELFDCFSWQLMSTLSQPTTCRSLPAEHSLGFINIRDVSCRLPSTRKNTSHRKAFLGASMIKTWWVDRWWTRHRASSYDILPIQSSTIVVHPSDRTENRSRSKCLAVCSSWLDSGQSCSVSCHCRKPTTRRLGTIWSWSWLRNPTLDNLQKVCCRDFRVELSFLNFAFRWFSF